MTDKATFARLVLADLDGSAARRRLAWRSLAWVAAGLAVGWAVGWAVAWVVAGAI